MLGDQVPHKIFILKSKNRKKKFIQSQTTNGGSSDASFDLKIGKKIIS